MAEKDHIFTDIEPQNSGKHGSLCDRKSDSGSKSRFLNLEQQRKVQKALRNPELVSHANQRFNERLSGPHEHSEW